MNELMQIKHDKDVLNDNELYEPNTPKKHKMASYENNQHMPGPDLEPMSLNWDEIMESGTRSCSGYLLQTVRKTVMAMR